MWKHDNFDTKISHMVNLIIILGKYHIHTCKWEGNTPSCTAFIQNFALYYKSVKSMKKMNRMTKKTVN